MGPTDGSGAVKKGETYFNDRETKSDSSFLSSLISVVNTQLSSYCDMTPESRNSEVRTDVHC
jgi:hypothetical protein